VRYAIILKNAFLLKRVTEGVTILQVAAVKRFIPGGHGVNYRIVVVPYNLSSNLYIEYVWLKGETLNRYLNLVWRRW
jgi:hypothetical protein